MKVFATVKTFQGFGSGLRFMGMRFSKFLWATAVLQVSAASLPKIPVYFEPNRGQFAAGVSFAARGNGYEMKLGAGIVNIELHNQRIGMRFDGADPSARWQAESASSAVTNYITAAGRAANVAHFERVRLKGIYPGIDFVMHGSGDQIEYDFIVHPGADPASIRLRITGAEPHLSSSGDLMFDHSEFLHRKPVLYQGGDRIAGAFRISDSVISFETGPYDRTRDLVIDPVLFHKSLGGNFSWASGIATDSSGNVYVAGYADSSLQATGYGGGDTDAVIAKFSGSGALVWLTYLGGSGTDRANAIAIDSGGNIVVFGTTGSSNFPKAGSPIQSNLAGGLDAFIVKLDAGGSKLLYSTYFGGAGDENTAAGMLDAQGNFLIGGNTSSTNLKSSGTPVQSRNGGGANDIFLARIAGDGSALLFVTYLGGSGDDELISMALDAGGNIYLAGFTNSGNLAATNGSKLAGATDALVAKLDPNASSYGFLTYLGGSGSDQANGIAALPDGSAVWIAGTTNSTNFPVSSKAIQQHLAADFDAFLTRIDAKGTMTASTYLGGFGPDEGDSVVLVNGTPVLVAVLTTDAYDKAPAPKARDLRPAALSQPELAMEGFSDDVSTVEFTVALTSTGEEYYAGENRCFNAGGTQIACAGAGFPESETGNVRGSVTVADVGSGNTPPPGFVPRTRFETSAGAIAPDPVDGATGRFYESVVDLKLGGPMRLGLARYYSSGLSAGGFQSSLGTNWMSNFDMRATISGATAQVLLFGGQTVTFTNSGGAWQLASSNPIAYQFVQSASAYKLMDPADLLIYTFNSSGVLTAIEDRNGNRIAITPGPNGPASATDNLGRTLTFTYAGSQLTRVQDQTSRSVLFSYTGNLLTSATDVTNQVWKYSYTSAGALTGLMTKKQYPLGEALTTQTYDSNGRVTSQTDPLNHASSIAYDSGGGSAITDPDGNTTKHGNSVNGDITQLTDPNGAAAKIAYDSSNRRTAVTDKLGNKTSYTYHAASGYIASATDALGNTTSYTYAAQQQAGFTFYVLTAITYPDGSAASFTYDSAGNRLSATLADGSKTTFGYDAKGRLSTVFANGGTTSYSWNDDFTLASVTDPLGNKTAYAYDTLKRIAKITTADGSATTYAYDAAGKLTSRTDPAGATASIAYDADARPSSMTNAAGGKTTFAYSVTGKQSSRTDPNGNKSTTTYDALDRVAMTTNAAGETATRAYDAMNRVSSITDGAGVKTTYSYDGESRVSSIADGGGRQWSYSYDAEGRLTATTSPLGNERSVGYDRFGRVVSETNPLGETRSVTRNALGRITGIAIPGGLSTSVTQGAAGPVSIADPNGNTTAYEYDSGQNLTKITDALGNSTSFKFEKQHLVSSAMPLGAVTFTYDAAARITKKQYSDGTTVNTTYDASGLRIASDGVTITRNAAGQPSNINGIGIVLDGAGRPSTLAYAAGKTIKYTYDAGGRLASVEDWIGGKTTFSYDAAGRLSAVTYPNKVANTYTYDAENRVSQIAYGGLGSVKVVRDASGKIVSADRSTPALNPASQSFSYDAANQMTSNAAYDKMGRATSQNGRNYTWNLASQLTGFDSTALSYDGFGEIRSIGSRSFVFNYLMRLPALSIVRQGSADLRYYVYAPGGRLLYSIEAGGNARHFYHFDEMGNTVMLTGDDGAMTDTYAIAPFGELVDHTGSTDNPFTWQGEFGVYQEASGLYYMRGRHYDAFAARFLSRDVFGSIDPQDVNPYQYAKQNPLMFVDPMGTSPNVPSTDDMMAALVRARDEGQIDGAQFFYGMILIAAIPDDPDTNWAALEALLNPPDPPDPPPPPAPAPAPPPPPVQPRSVSSTYADLGITNPGTLKIPPGVNTGACLASCVMLHFDPVTRQLLDSDGFAVRLVGGQLIGHDGGSLIGHDGGSLIGHDGGSLIGHDGGSIIIDGESYLIGHDGGSLIGHDGGSFTFNAAGNLIGHDGGSLVSNLGLGLLNLGNVTGLVDTGVSGAASAIALAERP